jgi:nicotinate-nucleotide adenylyltransferase
MAWIGYGGTFDPVHHGHIAVARAVHDALDASVHLLPAADPPHKHVTHADAYHRRRMLEIAVAGERGLRVDPRELEREGPSYSIDTLSQVRAEKGAAESLVWVIGADSLAQLHRWHRWQELFDIAHVLAVGRPGHALGPAAPPDAGAAAFLHARLAPASALRERPAGHLALLPMEPPRRESSTAIRTAAQSGAQWEEMVPTAVAAYIRRHRLYATAGAA